MFIFIDVKFNNRNVLGEAFRCTINCLLHDKEIPVKVEAAVALQMMLTSQGDTVKQFVEPQIGEITMELLKVIKETHNDDLTSVMQKIVCTYTEQLIPMATNISYNLVETFNQVRMVILCYLYLKRSGLNLFLDFTYATTM